MKILYILTYLGYWRIGSLLRNVFDFHFRISILLFSQNTWNVAQNWHRLSPLLEYICNYSQIGVTCTVLIAWRKRYADLRKQKCKLKNGLKMFSQKIQTNVKFLRNKKH